MLRFLRDFLSVMTALLAAHTIYFGVVAYETLPVAHHDNIPAFLLAYTFALFLLLFTVLLLIVSVMERVQNARSDRVHNPAVRSDGGCSDRRF